LVWQTFPIWLISNTTLSPTRTTLPTGKARRSTPSVVMFSAKSPARTSETLLDHLVDGFLREQTHLTMPVTCMRIALEPVVLQKHTLHTTRLANCSFLGQVHDVTTPGPGKGRVHAHTLSFRT